MTRSLSGKGWRRKGWKWQGKGPLAYEAKEQQTYMVRESKECRQKEENERGEEEDKDEVKRKPKLYSRTFIEKMREE